jgi:hypothetical protein
VRQKNSVSVVGGGRAEGLVCADPFLLLLLVRAALSRRCLTAVGHYFAYFGPSGAVQTVSDTRRPLFCIFFHFLVLAAVAKTPEGVALGFQIFAWAPK